MVFGITRKNMKKAILGAILTLLAGSLFAQSEPINPESITVNSEYTLPTTDGDNGEVFITDGSGNISFDSIQVGYIVGLDTFWTVSDTVSTLATQYDLTQIQGYTVANSANNRLITAVDENNGNAEINLTFDGSTLSVTGGLTTSGTNTFNGLTASTLAYLNASKQFTSLANSSGVLTNNGSGSLSWATAGDVTASSTFGTNLKFIVADGTGKGVKASAGLLNTFSGYGIGTSDSNTIAFGLGSSNGIFTTNQWTISADDEVAIQSTNEDITLTPNSSRHVNISAGGLEIGGTEVISSGRGLSLAGDITGTQASGYDVSFTSTGAADYSLQNLVNDAGDFVSNRIYGTTATGSVIGQTRAGNAFVYASTHLYTGTSGAHDYAISTNNVERFKINSSGTITSTGVRDNTTGLTANMYIDPTSGLMYRSTSSRRYKNRIKDYDIDYDTFSKIRPVTYGSKSDSTNRMHIGYIAEEIDEIGLTELVDYDAEGNPDALHYGQFTALNTAMIQKLILRIEELESTIEKLKLK